LLKVRCTSCGPLYLRCTWLVERHEALRVRVGVRDLRRRAVAAA
jgi:hypothetical protein